MKTATILLAGLILAGCATNPEAARQEAETERLSACMSDALGPLGMFYSPDTRQRALETCQKMIQPPPAN